MAHKEVKKAMAEVSENFPELKGHEWQLKVEELLVDQYNEGRTTPHPDAQEWAEIMLADYYADMNDNAAMIDRE